MYETYAKITYVKTHTYASKINTFHTYGVVQIRTSLKPRTDSYQLIVVSYLSVEAKRERERKKETEMN